MDLFPGIIDISGNSVFEEHYFWLKHFFQKISVEYKYITLERETSKPLTSSRILPRLTPKTSCWVARRKVLKELFVGQIFSKETVMCERHSFLSQVIFMALLIISLSPPPLKKSQRLGEQTTQRPAENQVAQWMEHSGTTGINVL